MTNDGPKLTSVARRELEIAGTTLIVHLLSNGQRVIEESSAAGFFEALAEGKIGPEDGARLQRFLAWSDS